MGDPWSELVDGPDTEGDGEDHRVPPVLLDLHVALEDSDVDPATFKQAFGE